jgi:ribosome-associated protein
MEEFQDDDLPISKTKRKQQAKEVEQLAGQLAMLPEKQFAQLKMTEELRLEVKLARDTSGRSSHKRQVKHLAAMLRQREEELQVILDQLQGLDQIARSEKREFHGLEKLRDRLCDQNQFDAAFAELLTQFPQLDRNTIARLARSVHQHGDKRAYREIFRRLRDVQTAGETD